MQHAKPKKTPTCHHSIWLQASYFHIITNIFSQQWGRLLWKRASAMVQWDSHPSCKSTEMLIASTYLQPPPSEVTQWNENAQSFGLIVYLLRNIQSILATTCIKVCWPKAGVRALPLLLSGNNFLQGSVLEKKKPWMEHSQPNPKETSPLCWWSTHCPMQRKESWRPPQGQGTFAAPMSLLWSAPAVLLMQNQGK